MNVLEFPWCKVICATLGWNWLSCYGGYVRISKSVRQKLQSHLRSKLRLAMSVPFFQTEMEVALPRHSSRPDYVCTIDCDRVAVSVTRAFSSTTEFTLERAIELLRKKIRGKSAKLLCFITDSFIWKAKNTPFLNTWFNNSYKKYSLFRMWIYERFNHNS